ncbi:WD40 repeat [Dillenia turbinata]|uniref:Elongator complex protein 2 n=1 Tax=Dillenia turbinata TaxID=194707 RepID=A0AAN8VQG5_9MAGN
MGSVGVERVFIGAGCNRIVNNVSWGACDLVAFGAQNAVSIFCPKSAQILTTLSGHKAVVNCTYWLPNTKFAFRAGCLDRHYLLSGDAEGAIILWEFSLVSKKWRHVLHVPEPHKKGVTCITGIMLTPLDALFASSSSDGTVHICELVFPSTVEGECGLSFLESITVGSRTMVALSLAELHGSSKHLILAMGGLDNKVHLYCGERTGKKKRLLLVSSSQDKGIHIWKIDLRGSVGNAKREQISLASYIEGPVISAGSSSYQISLESLLIGHEDWVYSVQWQPPSLASVEGTEYDQPLSILSASMDKTMMIWQPERTTGIWMNVVSVGELSHCALGFYGGHWSRTSDAILAHGYGGAFHLWKNVVTDISWARSGEYLISVSHDQTTRVFAPWQNITSSSDGNSWHEVARPQVHGHDINCVTIIPRKGNHRFVSGADEKVARVFEAPMSFLKTKNNSTSKTCNFAEHLEVDVQILGANMSALGLSQKPIYIHAERETAYRNNNNGLDFLETIPDAVPAVFTEPPIEDQLAWHTLWPESHKLYGHGNELFSLCCDHQGKLVASSCKAQSAVVAEIWLWQVGSWKAVGRLQSHSLTVTQLEFSHDDNFLLAVSRDRQFSVFSINRTGTGEISYRLVTRLEAHKRIIWACSWNPCGHEFATGSRDKTVKIWGVDNESSVKQLSVLPQFSSSATTISWACVDQLSNDGILAIGLESGLLELWSLLITRADDGRTRMPSVPACLVQLDAFMCHTSAVNRLAWKTCDDSEESKSMQFASCGADHSVRVYEVYIH